MSRKVNVVQGEEEIPTDIIADEIIKISEGVQKLLKGRLNERALIVLLKAACPSVTVPDIKTVLEGLTDLKRKFTK